MQILRKSSKKRFRLNQNHRRLLRILAAVVLLGGAGYMAWSAHRSADATARELAERAAVQAAADKVAARSNGLDDGAEETRLHAGASRSPADAARFAGWLFSRGRDKDALAFLDQLPETFRNAPPVRDSRVELLARGGSRDELRSALIRGDWGQIDSYALQLAFAAQTAAQTAHTELAVDLWKAALQSGASIPSTETGLLRLGKIWSGQSGGKIFQAAQSASKEVR